MNPDKAAEMLAWYSLAPDEVWDVAYREREALERVARGFAAKAPFGEGLEIMRAHVRWSRNWLHSQVRVLAVGPWVEDQARSLGINQSQLGAEAGLSSISAIKHNYHGITPEKIQRLGLASMRIRTGQSAFSK